MISVVITTAMPDSAMCAECVAAVEGTLSDDHEVIVAGNGLAGGWTDKANEGLSRATGDYLVVTQDDVTVLDGWWEPLRAKLDEGVAVVYPETVGGGYMRHDFAAWCFAMTRTTLERFSDSPEGNFVDERMKIWFSDTDIMWRLTAVGEPPVNVPESHILHGLSKTFHAAGEYTQQINEQISRDQIAFNTKWAK